jgi:hypothetical protein
MKIIFCVVFLLLFGISSFAQNIKLSGTVYDPNGAVVPKAKILAANKKSGSFSTETGVDGHFSLILSPGIYAIDVSGTGFMMVKYLEFPVINSTYGKMNLDVVMFGRKDHEPCGYAGAGCLPATSLIKTYTVQFSPKLAEIWKEFGPQQ